MVVGIIKKFFFVVYVFVDPLLPSKRLPFLGRLNFISSKLFSYCIDSCGKGVIINKGVVFSPSITIGNNVIINEGCRIRRGVKIGDDVLVAPNVNFLTENHIYENSSVNINLQGVEFSEINIGSNVWIGTNVIILPGSKVEKNSIIGAGAIVTKSFGPNSVIAGNPAKLIKLRK